MMNEFEKDNEELEMPKHMDEKIDEIKLDNDGNEVEGEDLFEFSEKELFVSGVEKSITSEFPTIETARAKEAFYTENIKPQKEKRKMDAGFKKFVAAVCIASVVGGSSIGFGMGVGTPVANRYVLPAITNLFAKDQPDNGSQSNDPAQFAFKNSQNQEIQLMGSDSTVASIVKQVEPSVVNISSTVVTNYFNKAFEQPASGSGIIFYQTSDKVYIVTNNHVIDGAKKVSISISGLEQVSANLVGKDAQADLAVIAVKKSDLQAAGISSVTVAKFGDSDKLEVGEMAIAIGNAMGEGKTATLGIVSSKNKKVNIEGVDFTVLQTDAAINPGNSGGPLVNSKGEVIGINTAKLSESAVEGFGFSIQSNIAKPIIEQLIQQGSVKRPYLGIVGQNITKDIAEAYSIPSLGVFVTEIMEGSSAAEAGLAANDIITSFDGVAITTMENLSNEIKKHKVGDAVEVKILRDGKKAMTLKVTLKDLNDTNNF